MYIVALKLRSPSRGRDQSNVCVLICPVAQLAEPGMAVFPVYSREISDQQSCSKQQAKGDAEQVQQPDFTFALLHIVRQK